MSDLPMVAIVTAVTVILVLAGAVIIVKRKGDLSTTDYRVFFVLGLFSLPIGIVTDNPGVWGLGALFLFVGLANRDKWQDWKNLSSSERQTGFSTRRPVVKFLNTLPGRRSWDGQAKVEQQSRN